MHNLLSKISMSELFLSFILADDIRRAVQARLPMCLSPPHLRHRLKKGKKRKKIVLVAIFVSRSSVELNIKKEQICDFIWMMAVLRRDECWRLSPAHIS